MDDLAFVGAFYFPRAIHHGHGVFQPIIDEKATDAQREALFAVQMPEAPGSFLRFCELLGRHFLCHRIAFVGRRFVAGGNSAAALGTC